jgi:hypothetical protein
MHPSHAGASVSPRKLQNYRRRFEHEDGDKPLGRSRRPNANLATVQEKSLDGAWLKRFLAAFNSTFDALVPVWPTLPRVSDPTPNLLSIYSPSMPVPEYISAASRAVLPLTRMAEAEAYPGDPLVTVRWFAFVYDALSALAEGRSANFTTVTVLKQAQNGHLQDADEGFPNSLTVQLIQALRRVDIRRLRRCAVCHIFFLAVRAKSTCCSPLCNNAYRQRQWYAREKERDALAAQLLSEGKDVREIARRLGLNVTRARAYVVRAKGKEHG